MPRMMHQSRFPKAESTQVQTVFIEVLKFPFCATCQGERCHITMRFRVTRHSKFPLPSFRLHFSVSHRLHAELSHPFRRTTELKISASRSFPPCLRAFLPRLRCEYFGWVTKPPSILYGFTARTGQRGQSTYNGQHPPLGTPCIAVFVSTMPFIEVPVLSAPHRGLRTSLRLRVSAVHVQVQLPVKHFLTRKAFRPSQRQGSHS